MSNEIYQAGIARADITPPVGIRLVGYTVREGVSHGVDEPLTATVLVLRGGKTTIAIIAHDWCIASMDFAAKLRRRCARSLGMPAANVLINFNHTHSAPVPPDYMPYDTPEQLAMQAQHGKDMTAKLEQACREAAAKLQPVRLAAGWGECFGNINRRQKMPDGAVLLGEDPNGPCDHSVGVLRVDKLNGAPLAIAFRYSCHTVTLGPKTNRISPDYAGAARAVIERALGCPSLFLQGCAGNVNPATGIGQDPDDSPLVREDKNRLGQMLGGEVLKVCATLRTQRRRKEPQLVQSVAVYWLYEYEEIPAGKAGAIRVAEKQMELPLTPFPPLAEVQREREEWGVKLADAKKRGAREWDWRVVKRFDTWAQLRLEAAKNGPNPLPVQFSLTVFDLGEIAFVAAPFELMSETGLALRAASPKRHTFVLGYSNGMISYLPTPEISREGGMESKLAYKAYLLPSELPGDWEPAIKRKALELLNGKE
ncbi:MAG: neutral/alkaline non-lysosomal ceramidase N-terminal domain-containing protein [Verrucomicrobia bacterium]|nr:neutral/alkaline non-lysosomal ceramidase N-terminal domain-containing protein [Verrucomicrobiota bacterium]